MTLYSLRHSGDQYRISKFTADLEVESSYLMTADECECPAGHRHTCRHRQMFTALLPICGTDLFYDYEHRVTVNANGHLATVGAAPEPVEPIAAPEGGTSSAEGLGEETNEEAEFANDAAGDELAHHLSKLFPEESTPCPPTNHYRRI